MLKSLVAAAVLFCAGLASAVDVGDQSLCIKLPHLDGSSACINEGNKEFVLVEFSSVFCIACQVNVPMIQNLAREIGGNTYTRFVYSNTSEVSEEFVRDYNIRLPFAIDSDQVSFDAYNIQKLPTMMLVDSTGKVVYVHKGALDHASLDEIRAITGN